MQAFIVWIRRGGPIVSTDTSGYFEGKPIAVFRTVEEDEALAQKRFLDIKETYNPRAYPGVLPPNVVNADHPHYQHFLETAQLWPEG